MLSLRLEQHSSIETQQRFDELVRGDVEVLSAITQELIEHRRNYLGEGMTAEVHFFDTRPGLCAKIVSNQTIKPEAKLYHPIKIENEFTIAAGKIKGNVKIPTPFFIANLVDSEKENDPKAQIIVMETIKGTSLAEIIEGASLPENFDIDSFFKKLRDFVKKMHEEANIYHRDLHEGNIMVTTEGEPVIIDFGAAYGTGSDAYEVEWRGKSLVFVEDERKLETVERRLRKALAARA